MSTDASTPAKLPRHPVSEDREAQLFWRMRWQMVRTRVSQIFQSARLRTTLIVGLSLLFWIALFVLFYQGFSYIRPNVGAPGSKMHATTFGFVFHLFFASLNLMLVFSAGIIFYGTVYRSPETRMLLSLPVRDARITIHKFQEALLFSCWGFFLLASPMMLAYGLVVGAPWHYFVLMLPMIVAFVYIPCSIGVVCCLLLVSKAPKLKLAIVATIAVGSMVAASQAVWRTVKGPQNELFGNEWFKETMHNFRFAQSDLLPSTWLSNGLLEAGRRMTPLDSTPDVFETPLFLCCMYLALLIFNALIGNMVVVWAGKRWLRLGYSMLECSPEQTRSATPASIDQLATFVLRGFSPPMRLLLLKDWRLLRRDPVQWSQFLIFFGLLGLYFLNLDSFSNQNSNINNLIWVNMVSFLNLAVVGLILSTFTTRFIYPMISLEGQRFWVLGLLPVPRETILWSKFVFASLGSWVPCGLLILASDLLLQIDSLVVVVHQFTCLLLCVGLAAIAVGLGATMPDFRESSPSKIAAGFGGTLNLVLSAIYIILIVVFTALPCHFYLIAGRSPMGGLITVAGPWQLSPSQWRFWLVCGMLAALVTAIAATWIPLSKGLRAFRTLELS